MVIEHNDDKTKLIKDVSEKVGCYSKKAPHIKTILMKFHILLELPG